jgi:hypothetical protein
MAVVVTVVVINIISGIYHRRRQNTYHHLHQSSKQLMLVLKIEKDIFINHMYMRKFFSQDLTNALKLQEQTTVVRSTYY